MKITVLGTGAPFERSHGPTQFMVQHGDTCCSVGFGYRAIETIEDAGMNLNQLTHVAVASVDADDAGGLEELAYRLDQAAPYLVLPSEMADALSRRLSHLAWASENPLQTRFRMQQTASGWRALGDLQIRAFSTGIQSFGFSIRTWDTTQQATFVGHCPSILPELVGQDYSQGPIFQDYRVLLAEDEGQTRLRPMPYTQSVRQRLLFTHHDRRFVEWGHRLSQGLPVIHQGDVIDFPDWRASLWGKTQPCLRVAGAY